MSARGRGRMLVGLAFVAGFACGDAGPAGSSEQTAGEESAAGELESEVESEAEAEVEADAITGGFDTFDQSSPCGPMCDPFVLGDCPVGEKCTGVACLPESTVVDANTCVPIGGDKAVGEACTSVPLTGEDDCAEGSICFELENAAGAACIGFCRSTTEGFSCPEPLVCVQYNASALPLCVEMEP